MIHIYFNALVWMAAMLLSFAGFGCLLNKIMLPKTDLRFGLRAALGLAFAVVLGGIMNLLAIVSKNALWFFVFTGIVFWLMWGLNFQAIKGWFTGLHRDKLTGLLLFTATVLFASQFLVTISMSFNPADDYQGYFVFTAKTIYSGSIGQDPFSERRIESGLGGENFLDAITLSRLSWQDLHVTDRGLGWLIFILLLWQLSQTAGLSKRLSALLVFSALLVPPPTINSTSVMTGAALFLALLALYDLHAEEDGKKIKISIFLAVILAGLCALKSSYIFPAVVLTLISFWHWRENVHAKSTLIKAAIETSVLSFLLLLPWMVLMYRSSHTLLYPVLGKGYHGSVYGAFLAPYAKISLTNFLNFGYQLATTFFVVFLGLGLLTFLLYRQNKLAGWTGLLVFLGAVVSVVVLAVLTGGYGAYRLAFAFLLPISYWLILEFSRPLQFLENFTKFSYQQLAIIVLAVICGMGLTDFFGNIKLDLSYIDQRLANGRQTALSDYLTDYRAPAALITKGDEQTYQNLQASLPVGAVVLTYLDKPFLLDFKRNQIYIVDAPGDASLPPGMPFYKGAKALADYLLSKKIRFVAYSYNSPLMINQQNNSRMFQGTMNAWLRSLAFAAMDFQDNLAQLHQSHKIIFEDNKNWLIDLASAK